MTTTIFDKEIFIDEEAADRLIALLNKPAPLRPDINGIAKEITEEEWRCFLQKHSEKLSAQNTKSE
jgi:hypothetical protein